VCECVCACACVRVCVCACVRACVCVYVWRALSCHKMNVCQREKESKEREREERERERERERENHTFMPAFSSCVSFEYLLGSSRTVSRSESPDGNGRGNSAYLPWTCQ